MTTEREEITRRIPNASLADYRPGQIIKLPNDRGQTAPYVIREARTDGEEIVLKVWRATTENVAEAGRLALLARMERLSTRLDANQADTIAQSDEDAQRTFRTMS